VKALLNNSKDIKNKNRNIKKILTTYLQDLQQNLRKSTLSEFALFKMEKICNKIKSEKI